MKKIKKQKHRFSATTALMWRLTAVLLGLWFGAMCYLTFIVAQDQYEQYVEWANEFMWYTQADGTLSATRDYPEHEEFVYYDNVIDRVMNEYVLHDPEVHLPLYENQVSNEGRELADWAIVLCDGSRQPVVGEDGYAYLTYMDEQTWFEYTEEWNMGFTRIDLNRTACGRALIEEWNAWDWHRDAHIVRLTGYFEGEEFVLADAAYYDEDGYNYRWYDSPGRQDAENALRWIDWYGGEVPTDRELVNIYVKSLCMDLSDSQVTVQGKTWKLEELAAEYAKEDFWEHYTGWNGYETLELMLSDEGWVVNTVAEELRKYATNNLWEAVIVRADSYSDIEDNHCPYAVAIRCQPIKIAMRLLARLYITTLVPIIVLLTLFCLRIMNEVTNPLERIVKYGQKDMARLPDTDSSKWREPYEMEQGYIQLQQKVHELKKEINQLTTALEYAKNAEENRKRMISNITHELKTPLAVIHSYAEGLQEGIAADRQDRYLEVILEESERMDSMVLEMLDLSRLEAGKVRLSSDCFSLLQLTRTVFDKLTPLVEEKGLEVEYLFPSEFETTADEGRMAQVITNLATNAIKYSPEGGKIFIRVFKHRNQAKFSIENQCPPLPEEDLERIWDSFYRRDASRTEKGTGLGLTITRTIIELHGGTCAARNTSTGVEFMFELP